MSNQNEEILLYELNAETGEIVVREMTPEEIAARPQPTEPPA